MKTQQTNQIQKNNPQARAAYIIVKNHHNLETGIPHSFHRMRLSLLQDLKELRNSKPVAQPPRNKGRMERVMQFEQANGICLSSQSKKKLTRKGGLFDSITFCFPKIDPANDPPPNKLVELAKGIYNQGGKLVQFSQVISNKKVRYILIDERTDVGMVRELLRGKLFYVSILNYKWVEECLRKLTKVEIGCYNLERDYITTEESRMKIRKKLEEEEGKKIGNKVQIMNKSNKNEERMDFIDTKQEQAAVESDSDTVVMQDLLEEQQSLVNQQQKQQQIKEKLQLKIQQMGSNFNQDNQLKYEIKQQDMKIELQPDSQIQHQQSKAFQWTESINDKQSNNSDATQKMQSDNEVPTKPPAPILKKLPITPLSTKHQMSQLPQVTRRKTKLTLGSHSFSTNNMICQKLKQMQQIYQNTGDRKQYAYLRAIAAIRNYGKEIRNAAELKNIEGLGRKTIDKIREFLQTGSIAVVDRRLTAKDSVPHKELLRVHGIGLNTAEELAHKGIRTLDDLRKNPGVLNRNQRMGLKYVDEFEQRIPRQKVAKMFQFVKQTLFYVARTDSHHQVQAVGSFRRGKATCGDMDILVTRRDGCVQRGILSQLVCQLERRGFITDHITQPKAFDGKKAVHYMGVCQFQGTGLHHRIDLKLYPVDQYAFALLYFTGSDLFNREMRMTAMERGLVLGDHGVRRQERNVGKPWKNSKIPICYTQKDVFDLLEMEYKPPSQREI